MTDPIADFLTRIRNAILRGTPRRVAPASKLKVQIAEVLKDEGYIAGFDLRDGLRRPDEIWRSSSAGPTSGPTPSPACAGARAPASACTCGTDRIPKVRSGLGIAILSTSRGLMTDRAARKEGVGGELLCEVW